MKTTINNTDRDNLTFDQGAQLAVKFVSEGAGYKNTLGMYTVEADGSLSHVRILAENLSGTGTGVNGGGSFHSGDLIASLNLAAGTEIGFFLIANGANENHRLFERFDLSAGTLAFVDQSGRDWGSAATLDDKGREVELVFTDARGKAHEIDGDIFHATTMQLNSDGKIHTVSGLDGNGDLVIAFEDLKGQGDRDFNDAVIRIEVAPSVHEILDPVSVAAGFGILDADDNTITALSVSLFSGGRAGDELIIDETLLSGTGITLTQNGGAGLTLSGVETAGTYEAILRSLLFENTLENPQAGERLIAITATDGDGLSDTSTIILNITEIISQPDPLADVFAALDNGAQQSLSGGGGALILSGGGDQSLNKILQQIV